MYTRTKDCHEVIDASELKILCRLEMQVACSHAGLEPRPSKLEGGCVNIKA
jgi:hypothetical protein